MPAAVSTEYDVGPCTASAATSWVSTSTFDVKTACGHQQPVELMMLRAQAVVVLTELKQGPVIDDLAFIIAPDNVGDPSRPEFG